MKPGWVLSNGILFLWQQAYVQHSDVFRLEFLGILQVDIIANLKDSQMENQNKYDYMCHGSDR